MSKIDTSAEAVERLAANARYAAMPVLAATLRAVAAERDECRKLVQEFMRGCAECRADLAQARQKIAEMEHYADQIRAERDALRAEVARTQKALEEIGQTKPASLIITPWREIERLRQIARLTNIGDTP